MGHISWFFTCPVLFLALRDIEALTANACVLYIVFFLYGVVSYTYIVYLSENKDEQQEWMKYETLFK